MIPEGQFAALIGPNGAGKSTLARHFNGLLRPNSGIVRVQERAITHRPTGELARHVGFLFQRPEQQIFATTVRQELAYAPRQLGMDDVERRVERALARFDLEPVADHPPAVLSYGVQRAVTLATLATVSPPILILDEPMVGLDGRGRAQLLHWLAQRRAVGTTIVVITHAMSLAACADRVIALEEGRIAADGPPETVLASLEWTQEQAA
jgi:energy-coupling factor transport system ATP-binding protein